MIHQPQGERFATNVRNLDAILGGGLPRGSVAVLCGAPGSGKTILSQQIAFAVASDRDRVLVFNTLSEPTAKTLRNLSPFGFFDPAKIDRQVHFVDLGGLVRQEGLGRASAALMEQIKRIEPALVVVDSFKVFDDLAKSAEELRKFSYEIAVNLMAWETTALLVGEYPPPEYQSNPLFSVVDGLITLSQRASAGEQQRFIQVAKLRGTSHSRDEHAFVITSAGIEIFAPRVTLHREPTAEPAPAGPARCRTGISRLDDLLGAGIPWGSSLLVAGVAGTGKTVLGLEFLYRGAKAGDKGIIFSFEETEERLRASARGLGWDLEEQIARGMIEVVFVPQPAIMVEGDLLMIQQRVEAFGARRVVIDSVSVFLHKIKDPQVCREKVFQLASVVQNCGAVGFFATDIPYGTDQLSRFGVEETVVDGIILLTLTEEALERQRYIEVYKLRNTEHLKGRHHMEIGPGGITIFPRYGADALSREPPPSVEISRRLSSGVRELDRMLGGGLLERSVTLVSGSPGTGKSTLGLQFLLAGADAGETGLYVTLEEGPEQIRNSAAAMGLPLPDAIERGLLHVVYLSRFRAGQFFSLLAEQIERHQVRRLVLDSVSHISAEDLAPKALQEVLYSLVRRFKRLGVTSLLTLESSALYSTESISDLGLSPVADNLVVLRYRREGDRLAPSMTVVKTRGSAHDASAHPYVVGPGGIRGKQVRRRRR